MRSFFSQEFSVAKEAVSYFIGIQTGYWDEAVPIISTVPVEILTNSQTNERMTIQRAYEPPMQARVGYQSFSYFEDFWILIFFFGNATTPCGSLENRKIAHKFE
jgi:hypothetical protein